MMAMLDLIDHGGELAAVPAVQAGAEYWRAILLAVSRHRPSQPTSLEQFVDGKTAFENNVEHE